jgi:hypothetical protein
MGDARAEVLQELTTFVDATVGTGRRWYAAHTFWPRLLFRSVGTAIILLSVSLPLVATQQPSQYKDLAVSVIGILVALLSGLAAFFRWDETWKGNVGALMELDHRQAVWELRILEARRTADTEQGIVLALQATKDLLEEARLVDVANTQTFFQSVRVPDAKK